MIYEINKHILKYNQQVPRYTSYPTYPHFTDKVNKDIYSKWLAELPRDTTLSLYLHIPFCNQLCWYCGCHTKMTKRYAPVENYVHLLKREIRIICELLGDKKKVNHIHFGGGSPSILSPNDFALLMNEIQQFFLIDKNAEIAIELDPRTVTEDKVVAYAKEGVNRVSIGVQDFHKEVQEAINRKQPFHVVYDSVKLLEKYGINNINLDLVYGLPNQTLEFLKENISYALLFDPNRIVLFGYAHLPLRKKHMQLIDENTLPNNEERLIMIQTGVEKLTQAGYTPIGFDHFARIGDSMEIALHQGTLRRNFLGYTTDNADALIGLGVSSISQLPQGYVQNAHMQKAYEKSIIAKTPATIKGIDIKKEDKLRRHIIEQLTCMMEVDISALCAIYGEDAKQFDEVIKTLEPLQQDGLIQIINRTIRIVPEARQIVRFVCTAFDQYLQKDIQTNISKANEKEKSSSLLSMSI